MPFGFMTSARIPEDDTFEAHGRHWRLRRVRLATAEYGIVVSLDRLDARPGGSGEAERDLAVAVMAGFALLAEEMGFRATCMAAPQGRADDGDWRCTGLVHLAVAQPPPPIALSARRGTHPEYAS